MTTDSKASDRSHSVDGREGKAKDIVPSPRQNKRPKSFYRGQSKELAAATLSKGQSQKEQIVKRIKKVTVRNDIKTGDSS